MVDWDLAVSTGTRLVRPGPQVTHEEARQAVSDLREYARQAHGHVAGFTGMDAPTDDTPGASVVVIDRPGWIKANAAGFRTVLEPLVEKLQERRTTSSPVGDAVGSKVTGVQTGSLLAFLATKVLGQYELFPPYGVTSPTSPAGCCSSRRTSCPPSGRWGSTPATSGSGCACTRRPTGCSSARCRGCAST